MPPDATVVVLGMHRSGTSAATRAVNLLGASLGRGKLWLGAPGNHRGHWESARLMAANDRILAALGGTWAGVPTLAPGWERTAALSPQRADAAAALDDVADGPVWVWKDPRACITLPLWRRVGLEPAATVIVLRHPAEVTASLHERDGFPADIALALWERYTRDAIRHVAGTAVLVTSFDDLVDRPGAWCREVQGFLAGHGADLPGDVEVAAASLDGAQRHHRLTGASLLSAEQEALLGLTALLVGAHERFDPGTIPPPTPGGDERLAAHGRAHRAYLDDQTEQARARWRSVPLRSRVRVRGGRLLREVGLRR